MTRLLLTWAGITALVIFFATLRADPVSVVVEGGVQFEPATLRLRVRVEPDAANRGLSVAIIGPDYESATWRDLEGDRAARTRWFTFAALPAGEYIARVDVVRPAAEHWSTSTTFRVLSRF